MLKGDTRNLPLQNIFQTLSLNQQEGVLWIQFQKLERHVAIRQSGVSFLTERPYESRLLQQALTRLKILSPREYSNVFATTSEKAPPGDVLLARHVIQPQHVQRGIREQLFEFLVEIFEWRGATYRFDVQKIGPDRQMFSPGELGRCVEFPVNAVLMEVARREDEWRRIREVIPCPHQIYRLRGKEHLQGFESNESLDIERLQQLFSLFDGERTLQEILDESPLSPFLLLNTLRALLEEKLAEPISVREKKALAERLRQQFQTERVLGIYRSILEDNPREGDIRKKLLTQLERKKVEPRKLAPHYRLLAEEARARGDIATTRQYLKKIFEANPRDIDAAEQLVLIEAESKRSKDFEQAAKAYVEVIRKAREYERGADYLSALVESRPKDPEIIHQAAHLYLLAGKPKEAAAHYERAAKLYMARRDIASLRKVIEKLESCDARAYNRWRRQIPGPGNGKRRRKLIKRLAVATMLFLVVATGAFVVYEWDARLTYAEVLENATRRAQGGDMGGAESVLEQFRKSYEYTFVASKVKDDIERLQSLPPPEPEHSGSDDVVTPPHPLPDLERFVTDGTSLEQKGEYAAALQHFKSGDLDSFPPEVARRVKERIDFLTEYLRTAADMYRKGQQAEGSGEISRASSVYLRILDERPFSPEAKKLRLPVQVQVQPRRAVVKLNGEVIKGPPPYLFHVIPGDVKVISVECPSFVSQSVPLDARQQSELHIQLQKRAHWQRNVGGSVEAESVILSDRVIVGSRSGTVNAVSLENGGDIWSFDLEGLGDPLGGLRQVGNDVAFVGTDGAFYRVDAKSGKRTARMPLPQGAGFCRTAMTPPDASGRVFLVTNRGKVIAIDTAEPKVLWVVDIGGSGEIPVVRAGDVVLAGSSEGRVVALRSADGKEIWSHDIGDSLTTSILASGDRMFLGTERALACLSIADASTLWKTPMASKPSGALATDGEHVFLTTADGRTTALSSGSGKQAWVTEPSSAHLRGVLLARDVLCTLDDDGCIRALDAKTGNLDWQYDARSKPGCPLVTASGVLVFGGMDHSVHTILLTGKVDKTGS